MKGFTYKKLLFTEKDPIIDEVRTVFFRTASVTKQWVEEKSGVTASNAARLVHGKTRPASGTVTVNAVLRALGHKLGVVPLEAADKARGPRRSWPPPQDITRVMSSRWRRLGGRDERQFQRSDSLYPERRCSRSFAKMLPIDDLSVERDSGAQAARPSQSPAP